MKHDEFDRIFEAGYIITQSLEPQFEAIVNPIECPYASNGEQSLIVRARNRSDWKREFGDLFSSPSSSIRCVLFGMPPDAINLAIEDLRAWAIEAYQYSNETFFGVVTPGCQLSCGTEPMCKKCKQIAMKDARDTMLDAREKLNRFKKHLQDVYKAMSPRHLAILLSYACDESKKGNGKAIQIKEIAKDFNVDPETVRLVKKEAKQLNSEAFSAIEAERKKRATINRGYVIGQPKMKK